MRAERAAAYLDVSRTYFLDHIAPQLAALRPSPGVVLYRRASLDRWLDQQEAGGAASPKGNPWHT
jgi:uncharacterized protein (DUF1810 family)